MHRYWIASFVLSVDRQAAADIQEVFRKKNCNFVIFERFRLMPSGLAQFFNLMTADAPLV